MREAAARAAAEHARESAASEAAEHARESASEHARESAERAREAAAREAAEKARESATRAAAEHAREAAEHARESARADHAREAAATEHARAAAEEHVREAAQVRHEAQQERHEAMRRAILDQTSQLSERLHTTALATAQGLGGGLSAFGRMAGNVATATLGAIGSAAQVGGQLVQASQSVGMAQGQAAQYSPLGPPGAPLSDFPSPPQQAPY